MWRSASPTYAAGRRLVRGFESSLRLTRQLSNVNPAAKSAGANGGAAFLPPNSADSFLQGTSASYLDVMFEEWRALPDSVDDSWKTYFRSIEEQVRAPARAVQSAQSQSLQTQTDFSQISHVEDQWRISRLVSAYRSLGHFLANIDPLGLREDNQARLAELSLEYYGFTTDDMDRSFALGGDILPHFATQGQHSMTLREIIAACQSVYCGNYGVEYQHIPDPEKRNWLQERLEVPNPINFSPEEKRRIFDSLVWTTTFDRFMAFKYPSEKRFGIAGIECLGPAMTSVIDQSVDVHGIESIVVGSCHRGRLAMLGTVWGKPREAIFAEFDNRMISSLPIVTGDPKYHLGYIGQRTSPGGRDVSLNYLAIPSHLEAVDPVATGSAYATQRLLEDTDKTRAMCLALHGDAAFTGQGVVYETIGLARLDAYQVGGTVRILVNNQIGFTTDADASRSTPYASDIAKFVNAPIIHVNADDAEAVTFACRLAADWRARFHDDIVIDLVCYRKVGHNDIDQPSFTQPIMYKQIADQIPPLEQYIKKLVDEGTLTATDIEEQRKSIWDQINREFDASKHYEPERQNFPLGWDALPTPSDLAAQVYHQRPTAIQHATLKSIAEKVNSAPPGFELHSNLQRVLAGRLSNFNKGSIDWSMAEALAFGSLCLEGHHVRITGQDVQRGTFSQRHSVLHDQATGEKYVPLNDLAPSQATYQASNSPLSEYGAMGFEYGVTLADPTSLVIWEAQFGDFTNNSQVVIDQFIFTGETKWLDRSGLVLSLPHGYDGQGAEHSSARLERFLMLCDGDGRSWPSEEALDRQHQDSNVSVVYMTSPANYFHVLRRQLSRDYRKPLIILFSKSLLRHPIARSDISLFTDPSATFQPVLADPEHENGGIDSPDKISRVVFCCGQVYAALTKYRASHGHRDTAIIRIEELHPFPWREVKAQLDQYQNVQNVVWAQEEPYNGGAWHYIRDRLDTVLRKAEHLSPRSVSYAGREPSPSAATGFKKVHQIEEDKFLETAFTVSE